MAGVYKFNRADRWFVLQRRRRRRRRIIKIPLCQVGHVVRVSIRTFIDSTSNSPVPPVPKLNDFATTIGF